jgi:threonine dehydratase
MYNLFYDTNLPQKWDTLADGLSGDIESNSITIALARFVSFILLRVTIHTCSNASFLKRKYVDKIVMVTDAQIENAMKCLVFDHGIVGMQLIIMRVIQYLMLHNTVEGAGAVAYAAAMQVVEHNGRPTAVILSGGNVDEDALLRVLNSADAWRKSSVEVL